MERCVCIGASASAVARRPTRPWKPTAFSACYESRMIVTQEIYHHTFANGLTLLLERMAHVRSAALYFLVPAGCIYDPPPHLGVASVLADLITRGAGKRD